MALTPAKRRSTRNNDDDDDETNDAFSTPPNHNDNTNHHNSDGDNDDDDIRGSVAAANIFLPLDPKKYIKTATEAGGVQKMTTELPAQLKLFHAGMGLVTFLAVDEFGTDNAAFSLPLQHACDSKPSYPGHDICQKLIDATGIIAYLPRRVSKEQNRCKQTKPNEKGVKFKQLYFVLRMPDKSKNKKKEVLELVAEFLNKERVPVEICPKYDQTNFNKQSLDNYIEDKYVLRLQNKFYTFKTDDTFFEKSSPVIRTAFFSPPYPPVAAVLGYPVVTPEDLSDDLDAEVAEEQERGTLHIHKVVSPEKPSSGNDEKKPICLD